MRKSGVFAALVGSVLLAGSCTVASQATVERTESSTSELCTDASGPLRPPTRIESGNRGAALVAPVDYDPTLSYPLLVSLHPFSMNSVGWESYSGLAADASERGYWVLMPNGSEPGPRWAVPGGLDTGYDDIGWIDRLITEAAETVCIDSDRIFAAGFSAGAAMAVGLSCELPWRFAAVAASGGSNLTSTCPEISGVDALIIHGTADPIAPLTGSEVIFAPPLGLPVAAVVSTFADRNECGDSSEDQLTASVVADVYSCVHRLEYWKMMGAGHTWAGTASPIDLFVGKTDTSFSANDAVLDFFDATE